MDFRWAIFITLWSFLLGPILSHPKWTTPDNSACEKRCQPAPTAPHRARSINGGPGNTKSVPDDSGSIRVRH